MDQAVIEARADELQENVDRLRIDAGLKTRTPFDNPRERARDKGIIPYMRSHLDLGTRIWLLIVSVIVLYTVIEQSHRNSVASHNATASCERAKIYGPRIVDLYGTSFKTRTGKTFQVLSDKPVAPGKPSPLQAYKDSLPTDCD